MYLTLQSQVNHAPHLLRTHREQIDSISTVVANGRLLGRVEIVCHHRPFLAVDNTCLRITLGILVISITSFLRGPTDVQEAPAPGSSETVADLLCHIGRERIQD